MKTTQILHAMRIVSWIIFIGLCVKAGAMILALFANVFISGLASSELYRGLDLPNLLAANKWYFLNMTSFVIAIALMKAYMFYLVIKIFAKINLEFPFNEKIAALLAKISYVAFGTGIIAILASGYNKWLMHRGITSGLNWESAGYLFMAGIIFIISMLFKRGIEIQSENELTI